MPTAEVMNYKKLSTFRKEPTKSSGPRIRRQNAHTSLRSFVSCVSSAIPASVFIPPPSISHAKIEPPIFKLYYYPAG